jgi:hypothetical protein
MYRRPEQKNELPRGWLLWRWSGRLELLKFQLPLAAERVNNFETVS